MKKNNQAVIGFEVKILYCAQQKIREREFIMAKKRNRNLKEAMGALEQIVRQLSRDVRWAALE